MLIQRTGIVLGKYRHVLYVGIGHITQCKIDAAVASCDRHR